METFHNILDGINGVIWHDVVLYIVLGVGVLFTLWSGICQFRSLSHGTQVIRGKYDDHDDPGAINHFQALSAALSATVGLGNIGGVAVAIALGGPGAVFWMWMIGIAGMALKATEVTLSMLYRNTDDPDNPHGGPMWVAKQGFAKMGLAPLGIFIGGVFVVTLLISAITGGNMFQAWNVGVVTEEAFNMPTAATGIILAVVVGAVIIGGIKRIGAVAGRIVPLMCALYLLAALVVLVKNIAIIPDMLALIVTSAFGTVEAEGAFMGGVWGYAFLWGMKRALFSSEAGQGSSPIAHSAAKTSEPVREGVVAGLEPFIDTIVVCTLTALVILSSGAWNRPGEATYASAPAMTQSTLEDGKVAWKIETNEMPRRSDEARDIALEGWQGTENVFMLVRVGKSVDDQDNNIQKISGATSVRDEVVVVEWAPFVIDPEAPWAPDDLSEQPEFVSLEVYKDYPGAALTTHAFNRVIPGMGTWLVLAASWLFAISTMISWSYYGEQGIIYLFGEKLVLPYKFIYCLLIVVATIGIIETDADLDRLTALGTGVMLWANIPIMVIFGAIAMRAWHEYGRKLKAGEFKGHGYPSITDVVEGHDVEDDK